MLKDKWRKSVVGVQTTKGAYEELCLRLPQETMDRWEEEEMDALESGGDELNVYGVRMIEGGIHFQMLSI